MKDLNVRMAAIKLLEETISRTLSNINCSNIFFSLDLSSKAKETKAKINKWDLIKIKSFYTAKEIINKTKRQPTEWEKIFANVMINRELISKIYKRYLQNNFKKQATKLKNGQRIWIDIFERRHTDDQLAHEKMLNIANHQRNANQSHNDIPPHTCQNGYYQKEHK